MYQPSIYIRELRISLTRICIDNLFDLRAGDFPNVPSSAQQSLYDLAKNLTSRSMLGPIILQGMT